MNKRQFVTEKLFNEIRQSYAKRGSDGVPIFVHYYEEKEKVFVEHLRNLLRDIITVHKNDLCKLGLSPDIAVKVAESIRADLYVMSLFSYMIADKANAANFEEDMTNAWKMEWTNPDNKEKDI